MTEPTENIELPSKYLSDMFNVLRVIVQNENADIAFIEQKLGMSSSSVFRHVARLRQNLKLQIDYVRVKGEVGKAGYYKVIDWGVLDKKAFKKHMLKG